jgi:hypothetical protein
MEAASKLEWAAAEMLRRDENERRHCLNWGPCSRMSAASVDRSGEAGETVKHGSTEGESAVPKADGRPMISRGHREFLAL